MLARKKRIDSSPKSSIGKNVRFLSKEMIADTATLLSTPTRHTRTIFSASNNDESPVLSQDGSVTWRWNSESTPIRSTAKSSKLRKNTIRNHSPHVKHRTNSRTTDNQNIASAMSPNVLVEPETHSPKGLYKFQEEMRKIQFDVESETSCDNTSDMNMSVTDIADTGYPNQQNVASSSNNNENKVMTPLSIPQAEINPVFSESFNKEDLLNDSDFDQALLTCTESVERTLNEKKAQASQPSRTPVNKVNSAPELKTANSNSDWNLFNDESIDDLLCNIDVDIPANDALNSSKFQRHKSMPQSPTTTATAKPPTIVTTSHQPKQQTIQMNSIVNRRSFIRHESMPTSSATNNFNLTNRQKVFPPNSASSTSTSTSSVASTSASSSQTQPHKCTSAEIAEKRRLAMERLKSRNTKRK